MKELHPLLKHTRCYFSSPDPAPPRNFTNEMLQTLAGYQQTAPGYLAIEQQFQPQYQQLSLSQQLQGMLGYTDAQGAHQPGSLEMQRFGTQYQRAGDIADVAALGPASTQAFLAANPYLASGLNNLLGRTGDSQILQTLNSQANAGLAGGGALSPQEQRALDQQTRAGFSARGNVQGNQALGSELLNRDAMVRQRMQQAQAMAGQVQGMNQSQNDMVGRATQIFGTQLSDPFQAILGRSSGSGGGTQQQIGTGARLFDPLNPYAQDVYSSNQNATTANNIAQAQAQNATTGAAISAAGSILGGLLSDERAKTNIKRTGEKTKDGVDIVEWEYKTDPKKKRYRGVLAQELEEVDPDAVITDEVTGLKLVKDGKAPMQQVMGKGKNKKYLNLVTMELEEAA